MSPDETPVAREVEVAEEASVGDAADHDHEGDADESGTGDGAPDKSAAVVGYLACALIPIGFFLGPLATWLIWRMRREDPFADFHGRQALDLTGAGLLAYVAVWLFLLGADALLVPRGFGAFMANLSLLQPIVVALYAGLLVWGLVSAVKGQRRILPLGLPWLRARAKNEETLKARNGQ